MTVFSFPPDKGNVGTAAYLNVFGSIFRVLESLQREGYNVGELPATGEELIQSVSLQACSCLDLPGFTFIRCHLAPQDFLEAPFAMPLPGGVVHPQYLDCLAPFCID